MEMSQASERYSPCILPRWRSTELMAFGQQLSPGGMGMSSAPDSSKSAVDDSLLSDLMDLDSLSEQLGEAWNQADLGLLPDMGGSDNSANFSAFSSFLSSDSQSASLYSHSNASSMADPFPQAYLLQEVLEQCSSPEALSSASSDEEQIAAMVVGTRLMGDARNRPGGDPVALERNRNAATTTTHGSAVPTEGAEAEERLTEEKLMPKSGRTMLRVPVGPPLSLRDRMMQALRFIGRQRVDVLAQAWMPVTTTVPSGGGAAATKTFLTTREQPYVLEHKNDQLWMFRTASERYEFPANGDQEAGGSALGLPGRVFARQAPEWTPNVQFYSQHEYLRVKEARRYGVRGSLAVPVLDPLSRRCLAVIELVGRAEKVQYGPDLDIICRALQAVNLTCTDGLEPLPPERRSQGRQAALTEIAEVLTAVCETHKLPLAQTWVPRCTHGGTNVKTHNGSKRVRLPAEASSAASLRTGDGPCYVSDGRMWGFRRACLEHSMERGQGVPGKAFASNQPVFEPDVKSFHKGEYPLGHYAKWFGLAAAVAIRLRSIHTGSDDFILEFFLPPTCVDSKEQQLMLNSLSITMQRICRSLRTVSDKELEDELQRCKAVKVEAHDDDEVVADCSFDPHMPVATQEVKPSPPLGPRDPDPTSSRYHASLHHLEHALMDFGCADTAGQDVANHRRRLDRRRGTSEKMIGLGVLVQYFAGSLKDAAKSIGVCPTTLKRICRQHGISRWPSRKINKVSRSLKKLQGVIDSVQGADGALHISALAGDIVAARRVGKDAAPPHQGNWSVSWSTPALHDCGDVKEHMKAGSDPAPGPPPRPDDAEGEALSGADQSSGGSSVDVGCGHATADADAGRSHQGSPLGRAPEHPPGSGGSGLTEFTKTGPGGEVRVPAALKVGPVSWGTHHHEGEDKREVTGRPGLCALDSLPFGSSPMHGASDCSSPSSCTHKAWPPGGHEDGAAVTVKVTYGLDTARFKLAPGTSFLDLRDEVSRRLTGAGPTFDLKYLDDDDEWMGLACDADLQECIQVTRVSGRHAIKLRVRRHEGASLPGTGADDQPRG